jgi:integrase
MHPKYTWVHFLFNRICKKNQLFQIMFHQMRHSHASILFEAGANVKDVHERFVHTNISTTLNIYMHVTDVKREKTAELFANYMEG